MPKVVDHEQRRRAIADAVCAIAATEGLEAVSVRRVAARAGMSAPLVQRYFPDKAGMLQFAITEITETAKVVGERRIATQFADHTGQVEPKLTRAILSELLPLDEARRTLLAVQLAYFTRAMHDPEVASIYRDSTPELATYLTGVLEREHRDGRVSPGLDLRREAETLVALAVELSTEMLLQLRTTDTVLGLLDYHLHRLFGGCAT